jgi:hypothetical protein
MTDQQAGAFGMFMMRAVAAQTAVNAAIEAAAPKHDHDPEDTAESIVEKWNRAAQEMGLPQVRSITPQRKKKIAARMREPEFHMGRIIEKIMRSNFLRGENDRGWTVNFDFVIRSEDSYTRILEGMYGNKKQGKRTSAVEAAEGKYDNL